MGKVAEKVSALLLLTILSASGHAQTSASEVQRKSPVKEPAAEPDTFKLALPNHDGQLQWHADSFKATEYTVTPDDREIGLRGEDATGRLSFLAFLSFVPEQAPVTSAKCADNALQSELKENPSLKTGAAAQLTRPDSPPVQLVSYTELDNSGRQDYSVRGFVATGNICGDLEVFSALPIKAGDPDIKKLLDSYRLAPRYSPVFNDFFLYAQVLFQDKKYEAAGPMYEQALLKIKDDGSSDQKTWRRFTTAQAGESYGMAGDITKARSLMEAAVAKDPDYPIYYYKLASADAADNKLADARTHLQQAFARKANVLSGETLPDPTKDDTFQPYKDNKDFWAFLQTLH